MIIVNIALCIIVVLGIVVFSVYLHLGLRCMQDSFKPPIHPPSPEKYEKEIK